MSSASSPPKKFKGCLAYVTSPQIAPNSTYIFTEYDEKSYDTDNFHDSSVDKSKFTVPAGVKKIRLSAYVQFGGGATGNTIGEFFKNGGSLLQGGNKSNNRPNTTALFVSGVIDVEEGDYFQLRILQVTGSTRYTSAATTWFAVEVVE